MCTALSFRTSDHYFGRNLDLTYSGQESVVVIPRRYPLPFRFHPSTLEGEHYAMIGVAWMDNGYPLLYDATNEKGLSMAGLNFPGNADYKPFASDKDNIPPFEFIPWILGQCATVEEARILLQRINLLNEDYSEAFPLSPLHWIIADRECAVTVRMRPGGSAHLRQSRGRADQQSYLRLPHDEPEQLHGPDRRSAGKRLCAVPCSASL